MKKIMILTLFIFILISPLLSKIQISLIREKLENEDVIEKIPFTLREFKPYLNGQWIGQAVSYGCYRKEQAPWGNGPSIEEILEDLTIISEYWNLIRVYNADDDSERILQVIAENNLPVQVILGVWLVNEDDDPAAKEANIVNTIRCLKLADKYPQNIAAINVGNETQVFWSGHRLDSSDLIRYIRIIRSYTKVPVTTADDYNFWNKPESKAIAAEIDFIITHIYPLWNSKTLDESINWLDKTYNEVSTIHNNKQVILGEIGWATNYNPDKQGPGEQGTLIKGEVSLQVQEKFLIQLDEWIQTNQITTFLFEAFDESWKGGGEASGVNEIEKNWGVFYEDRTPKQSFTNFIKHKAKTNNQFLKEEK
jgi:exo-beta-1,3-glucanase (GH17 family)